MKKRPALSLFLSVLLISGIVSLVDPGAQAGATQENISCSSTGPWLVVSSKGKAGTNGLQAHANGLLVWQFPRGRDEFFVLASKPSLNGFTSLRFDVCSKESTTLALMIDDADGAKFHAPIRVGANQWQHVEILPSHFKINDDSPVKKAALDPARVTSGITLVDFSVMLGATTPNTVQLKSIAIEKQDLPLLNVPAVIDGKTVEIGRSGLISGNIDIRNGGVLRIRADRIRLKSNISINRGTLEFSKANIFVETSFPHERQFNVGPGATMRFLDCSVSSPCQMALNMPGDRGKLEIINTRFSIANLTVASLPGNDIAVINAKSPGEFVLSPGTSMRIQNSEGVLLWPIFGASNPCKLESLTTGSLMGNYTLPASSHISLQIKSSKILWAALVQNGCNLQISNSRLLALGVQLKDAVAAELSNIRNNQPAQALLKMSDRTLSLKDTNVGAWNFYVSDGAKLHLKGCLFGEAMAFNKGRIDIENSTCDGTGGYIGSSDDSTMSLINCTLQCPCVAKDRSHMTLAGCTLKGDVTSSGNSTIELRKSWLGGKVNALGGSTINKL